MVWFRAKNTLKTTPGKKSVQVPEGVWTKCKNCQEIIYAKEIERNLNVCPSAIITSASAPVSGSV